MKVDSYCLLKPFKIPQKIKLPIFKKKSLDKIEG